MSEHLEERLYEFAAGQLEDQARWETHVAGCAACRLQVEQTRALFSAVEQLTEPPVSPDFDARLFARLDALEAPTEPWWQRLGDWLVPRRVLWTGGLAAAAAATFFVLRPRETPDLEALAIAEDLELLEDLELVENLDVLDDLDVIELLEEPT